MQVELQGQITPLGVVNDLLRGLLRDVQAQAPRADEVGRWARRKWHCISAVAPSALVLRHQQPG